MITTKFRKPFKKQLKTRSLKIRLLPKCQGTNVLIAAEFGILTSKQIESARRVISRLTKRKFRVYIHILANQPITAKPNEVRMGKGKGAVNQYVRFIRPGDYLFAMSGANTTTAHSTLLRAAKKLPLRCTIF